MKPEREVEIRNIILLVLDGLLTVRDGLIRLDGLKVRGGFDRRGFTGYDYEAQCWITR